MALETREIQYNELLWKLYDWKYPLTNKEVGGRGVRVKEVGDITFQVTEACSLCCKYCYQHDKTPAVMSFDMAKKCVDRLFTDGQDKYFALVLDFIGGEPLLQPKLISDIIDYFDYKCLMEENWEWAALTRFSICTNGTEYKKPEVQKLLNKIRPYVSFTVSIDGNKELHDSARVHPDGSGSYDEAIFAATDFEEKTGYSLGSKMTIAPSNVIFTYSALKHYLEQGKTQIFANCVFEDGWTYDHAKLFYEELKKFADFKLANYPEVYVSIFEEDCFRPMDPETENSNWCGGNGNMIAFAPSGIVYPCLRFMPTSVGWDRDDYITCGHVDTGIDFKVLEEMQCITRRSQSTDECFNCPIAQGCAWCTAWNWESQGSINKRATYICPMHKARALANVYYWNKYYRQIGSEKRMKNYCPEDWALQIISKEEFDMLNDLAKEN